jgi:hypothetical protein
MSTSKASFLRSGAAALAFTALPTLALAADKDIPRASDGRPDLSGTYDVATLTPLQRPTQFGDNLYLTREQALEIEKKEQELLARGLEQSTAWWVKEQGPGPYDNPEQRPAAERCLLGFGSTQGPPMLPVLYNNHKRIVQTRDHVMILVEMVHDARIVRLNAKHEPPEVRKWLGDSIGWWEGDTLVIDNSPLRVRGHRPQHLERAVEGRLRVAGN